MKKKTLLLIAALMVIFTAGNSYSQMFWNQAMAFSGNANSYVVFPHNNSLFIVGDFSVEAWVNPSNVTGVRSFIAKNNGSYGLGINNGRAVIFTNSAFRLHSKTTSTIPVNKWTHIAGTYNFTQNKFELYINGVLDTSSTVPSAAPGSGSDSLYIGKSGGSYYLGMLDEVRIWSKTLTAAELKRNFRTSLTLGSTDASYTGLSCSLPFQGSNSTTNRFFLANRSPAGGVGYNRGALEVDMTNKPYTTIAYNLALEFDGNGDHTITNHTSYQVLSSAFTLEAWVYIRQHNGTQQVIMKKRNASAGYEISSNSQNKLTVAVNGTTLTTGYDIPLNRWVHVALSVGANGSGKVYADGTVVGTGALGLVTANTEALFIGGSPADNQWLNGYIDEVRISKYEKTHMQIREYMYKSIDLSNDPGASTQDIIYNFDGSHASSSDGLASVSLEGDTRFSDPNSMEKVPSSPMLRNEALNFSNGFNIKTSDRRIPEVGSMGQMKTDSLYVPTSQLINDVNFFIAVNHTYDADLEITLFAPNGDSVNVCFDHMLTTAATGDIITIFDSNADSSILNGLYTALAPSIRPDANMNSTFLADNSQGYWRLKINDDANGDTGRVYAWGLQFNNSALVGTGQVNNTVPEKFELSQNYPNPFNPVTNIKFQVPQSGIVKLTVYDILGKELASLVNEFKQAGSYTVTMDGSKLSSGAYFYKLESGSFTETKKMLLIK